MMKYRNILLLGLLGGAMLVGPFAADGFPLFGKKKKKAAAADTTQVRKETPYDKIFKGKKGVVTRKGFMTVHKVEDKVYLEVPWGVFGRELLLATHADRTSDVGVIYPGMITAPYKRLSIDRTDSLVLLRAPVYNVHAEKGEENIAAALTAARINAIERTFPIAAVNNDSTAVIFDATPLFSGNNKELLDLRGQMVGDYAITNSELISERARLDGVEAFGNSIAVTSEMAVRLTLASLFELAHKPEVSARLVSSLTLLPSEKMAVREADPRIGTRYVKFTRFRADGGTKDGYFASRWRLEPKDPEAIRRGELSEPVKPVTIYVDSLFPQTWYEAVAAGVGKWNSVLEGAGFKNAVRAVRYPADSLFDARDPMNSCIRFAASLGTSVTGRVLTDPRTGEILSLHVTVPRDYAFSVRRKAVYLLADVDERYREYFLPDDAVCEVLTSDVMRIMAAGLGLAPNLAGSAAYTVEQMRDPEFTRRYGFTASVTDPVTFNYAALPGDRERGVVTVASRPGVYDEFALKWLYMPLYEQEKETLNRWLAEKSGDPRYFYGKQQRLSLALDPRAIGNDLGSDIFASIDNGMTHLKYVALHSPDWFRNDSIPQAYRELFPDWLFLKMRDYVVCLVSYVGGIYQDECREGSPVVSCRAVPREVQKKAMRKTLELCSDFSWMDANPDFVRLGGPNNNMSYMGHLTFPMDYLMRRVRAMGLSVEKSDDPYTQREALDDISAYLFQDVRAGKEISQGRFLQMGQYIVHLIAASPVLAANYKRAKGGGDAFAGERALFPETTEGIRNVSELLRNRSVRTEELRFDYGREAGETDAMEPLTGLYFYFPESMEPLCYNKLLEAKRYLQQGMAYCRDEIGRGKYRHYISLIDLALEND